MRWGSNAEAPRAGDATMALERELEIYRDNLLELLTNEGKWVIIGRDGIAGVRDTYDEALAAGYERFGLGPFLVKQVRRAEPIHYFSRDLPSCRS